MSRRRVSYFYDNDIGSYTYGLGHCMKPHRMKIAHELIGAYGMLNKMDVLRPARTTPQEMTAFHTDEYIHFLNRVTPETMAELTGNGSRFLVPGVDNPAFDGLMEFCSISAGGSIAASSRIASGAADVAINWAGGLHHAKKNEAAGFCYINDIVLGILELLRTYPRVLYIDIDCHHGDGVEEAFYTTDRVMTFSLHKFGDYFPGTGLLEDKGHGKGKGYSVNIPLSDGINDDNFRSIFDPVMSKILDVFQPSVVVLQCGADSLSGDKLGCFNLTMEGHAHCVQFLRARDLPLILLGGGGYTVKNVARVWTFETACALGLDKEIDRRLPWNDYFEWFGPRYRLEVLENNMEDVNMRDNYLNNIRAGALAQLSEINPAPSVQMHDVPRQDLASHLGFKHEIFDDLDSQLAQHSRFIYDLQEPARSQAESSDEEDAESDHSGYSMRSRTATPRRRFTGPHKDAATRSRIMSIMTNEYLNLPAWSSSHNGTASLRHRIERGFPGLGAFKQTKRRFFEGQASEPFEFDEESEDVDVEMELDDEVYDQENMDYGRRPRRHGRLGGEDEHD